MFYMPRTKKENKEIAEWVSERENIELPEKYYSVAAKSNGNIIAAYMFTNYTGKNIMIHAAVDNPFPLRKKDIGDGLGIVFKPPFNVIRITSFVDIDNRKSKIATEKIGFKQEGVVRNYKKIGDEAYLFGMTVQDWEKRYGQA